jgi:hypothetical protein
MGCGAHVEIEKRWDGRYDAVVVNVWLGLCRSDMLEHAWQTSIVSHWRAPSDGEARVRLAENVPEA